jgi:hypothetical protein
MSRPEQDEHGSSEAPLFATVAVATSFRSLPNPLRCGTFVPSELSAFAPGLFRKGFLGGTSAVPSRPHGGKRSRSASRLLGA